jgi:hypothetical protein
MSSSSKSEKVLENGIKLGSIFKDFHETSTRLEARNSELELLNESLVAENAHIRQQHDDLLDKLHDRASKLTREHSSHLAALDILNQARIDKDELSAKYESLVKVKADQDVVLKEKEEKISNLNEQLIFWETKYSNIDELYQEEKNENEQLTNIIFQRDERIENLLGVITEKEDEINILQKSAVTKDKQLLSLCKDRDRLKDRIEAARRHMHPQQRSTFDKISPGAGAFTTVDLVNNKTKGTKVSKPAPNTVLHTRSVNAANVKKGVKKFLKERHPDMLVMNTRKENVNEEEEEKESILMMKKSNKNNKSAFIFDLDLDILDLSTEKASSVKERQYQGEIRKLRQELAAAKSTISNSN